MPILNTLQAIPTAEALEKVHEAIQPYIHRTPIMTNQTINQMMGAELYLKCENLQKIGAFKMRGATSALLVLSKEQLSKGVATHSSGNHAQALALSSKLLGVKAYIVMPSSAPKIKQAAVVDYGAEVILCAPTLEARIQTLEDVVARTGATYIPSFDHYDIIAGQGTAAKELIEDAPKLDVLIAPVGGGGLMSGTALSASYWSPETLVYGAEPKAVDDAYRSLKVGKRQTNCQARSIADGLLTNIGERNFEIIAQNVKDIITVSEKEIAAAMRLIWERMKLIVEPSGAVPLAALLQQKEQFKDQKIGVILSGGNVDLDVLPF